MTDRETLIGAFFNNEPRVVVSEFDPSLYYGFFKNKHPAFLAGGQLSSVVISPVKAFTNICSIN